MILYQQESGGGDIPGRSIIIYKPSVGLPPVYPPGPLDGRTLFYFGDQAGNPIAGPVDVSDLTKITAPALGVSSPNGTNGAQNTGAAWTLALAPRAFTNDPYVHGATVLYNFTTPPKPFILNPTLRIEMTVLHGYSYIKTIAGSPHTMEWEGNSTFYSTLAFKDITSGNALWFVTRFYQWRYASEPYEANEWSTWSQNEVFYVDPSNNFAVIDSILQPSSTRVVPVSGTSMFYTGVPKVAWLYYGYDINANTFSQTLTALNAYLAAQGSPRRYSSHPGDYQFTEWNFDAECWAIYAAGNPPSDVRLAVGQWDCRITTLTPPANPTLVSVPPAWIPTLQVRV